MIVQLIKLFFTFFKIGILGFGGGYAMFSMIINEATALGITELELGRLAALDMVVPGPIAINAATYVGYLDSGLLGATFATIGVALPSLIIIPIVLKLLDKFKNNQILNGALKGIKPAAVGLIAAASVTIAKGVILYEDSALKDLLIKPLETISITATLIFIFAFFLNTKFKVNPIILTLIAAVIGAFLL